jgi:hypothetical protein
LGKGLLGELNLVRKLFLIRSRHDLAFIIRDLKYVYEHLKDFAKRSEMREL